MRTVLQIVQQAYGELGLVAPGSLAGTNAADAIQVLALLNREGAELADIEGGWPALRGEQIITLVPGTQSYAFPTDIAYYSQGTSWDRSTRWQTVGPLSAIQWQELVSGSIRTLLGLRYRIMNGQIDFLPMPSAPDTLVFEYVSANWCVSSAGKPQAAFAADDDVPLLPDDLFVLGLKWRLLAARGMNYAEERSVYDRAVDRKRPRALVAPVLKTNIRRDPMRLPLSPGAVTIVPQLGTPAMAFRQALMQAGVMQTVLDNLPADQTSLVTQEWITAAAVSPGDALATFIAALLGYSAAQMAGLFAVAALFARGTS